MTAPVKIVEPIGFEGDWLIFAALSDDKFVAIRVGVLAWEELQAGAPSYMDGDDRRDYALGLIEAQAELLPSVETAEGPTITLP